MLIALKNMKLSRKLTFLRKSHNILFRYVHETLGGTLFQVDFNNCVKFQILV